MDMSTKVFLALKITVVILFIFCQTKAQLKEWKIPCGAIYKPDNCENSSVEALDTVEDFERCAPALLDVVSREYVWRGSGEKKTFFGNKEAYKRIWIKRKVLRGHSNFTLATSVFGQKIAFPLGISPTAGQTVYNQEGERGMAKGAASVGIVYILDIFALTSLEDVAAAVPEGSMLWMQTYIHPNRELTANLVKRAEKAGFKAIVVTLDEAQDFDVRCHGIDNFFNKYLYSGPNIGINIPNYDKLDTSLTFKDLSWLVGITKLPVVAKGILTGDDAVKAVRAGAKAVFVSNQGGRHFDDALPTIDALPEIMKALKFVHPKVDVFVDGGIRNGHDIYKALARGAKMAFIGRPAIWGLTVGGEKGVKKVLNILKNEFQNGLIFAGYSDPRQISPKSLISKWIYSDYP